MDKSNRFSELDALRGLAALGVVIFHYGTAYNDYYKDNFLYPLILFGQYAVPLFFMISGFVILMTMERTKSGQDFVVGRFSRLYPAYWASLIIHLIVTFVLQKVDFTLPTVLWNFTMLQKFFQAPNLVIIYWTLSIELSFYLVMLLLFKFKLLKHIDAVSAGWLVLLALNLVSSRHSLSANSQGLNWADGLTVSSGKTGLIAMVSTVQPISLITGLKDFIKTNFVLLSGYAHFCIAGFTLYRAKQFGFSVYRWLILAGCVLIQWFDYANKGIVVKIFPRESIGLTLVFVLLIALFYLAIQNKLRFLTAKPFLYLGTISYALYLSHIDIGMLLIPLFKRYAINPNISIPVTICLAVVVASLITFKVEKPSLDWIRTHYKKRDSRFRNVGS